MPELPAPTEFPAPPAEVLHFYRDLAHQQSLWELQLAREGLSLAGGKAKRRPEAEILGDHLQSGRTLVEAGLLSIREEDFLGIARELLDFLAGHRPALEEKWEEIRAALNGMRPAGGADCFPSSLVQEAVQGNYGSWYRLTAGISPAVLDFFLQQALRPFLRPLAVAFGEWLPAAERDRVWQRGRCPVCGRPPALARLGEEGRRYLRCLLCDAEWLFKRLACPFCGNEDCQKLGTLRVDGDEGGEIHFCDNCSGYLKVIRRAVPEPARELDLNSLYLDLVAEKAGLRREG